MDLGRTGDAGLLYLLGDHLGSTTVAANPDGTLNSKQLYMPFGESRYTSGSLPTDYRFTGQMQEPELGLYYYGARYYDPYLGRFISADTIVPTMTMPIDWDRYNYVHNNPVRYTDPSGHCIGVFSVVCVIIGATLIAGLIPGDSRIYEWDSQYDPVMQLLVGLILYSGGGGFPTIGGYLSNNGNVTNEISGAGQTVNQSSNAGSANVTLTEELIQQYAKASTVRSESNEVVIGLYNVDNSYTAVGEARQISYFNMSPDLYNTFQGRTADLWKINERFLQNAIDEGKYFIVSTPWKEALRATTSNLYKEIMYLLNHGYKHIFENGIDKLVPIE